MNKEHQMHQAILLEIMEEMQKDFYDTKWWTDGGTDPVPLLMGIWEFKEAALELGFTIGITQGIQGFRGAFNRETSNALFIEEALTYLYTEVVQNSGVFLTHSFFDTRCQDSRFKGV